MFLEGFLCNFSILALHHNHCVFFIFSFSYNFRWKLQFIKNRNLKCNYTDEKKETKKKNLRMDIPTYLKSLIDVTMRNSNLTFIIKSKGMAYWLKITDIVRRLTIKFFANS